MKTETSRSIGTVRAAAETEFMRTGVFWTRGATVVLYPRKQASGIDVKVRVTMREFAAKTKRPFIHATSEWYGWRGDEGAERLVTILTIPKLVKLRTVTMGLYIAAVENKESWSRWNTEDVVTRWENKTSAYFQFIGDDGHMIFESWLDQCITDPVFRVVLNNTTPVTPRVIPLAA